MKIKLQGLIAKNVKFMHNQIKKKFRKLIKRFQPKTTRNYQTFFHEYVLFTHGCLTTRNDVLIGRKAY